MMTSVRSSLVVRLYLIPLRAAKLLRKVALRHAKSVRVVTAMIVVRVVIVLSVRDVIVTKKSARLAPVAMTAIVQRARAAIVMMSVQLAPVAMMAIVQHVRAAIVMTKIVRLALVVIVMTAIVQLARAATVTMRIVQRVRAVMMKTVLRVRAVTVMMKIALLVPVVTVMASVRHAVVPRHCQWLSLKTLRLRLQLVSLSRSTV